MDRFVLKNLVLVALSVLEISCREPNDRRVVAEGVDGGEAVLMEGIWDVDEFEEWLG